MIEVFDHSGKAAAFKRIRSLLKSKKSFWIHGQSVKPGALSDLQKIFDIHPVVVEDIETGPSRPKMEFYDKHLFIVSYGFINKKRVELDIILGKNFIATFTDAKFPLIEKLKSDKRLLSYFFKKGPAYFLHALVDEQVGSYFPLIEEIDDDVDDIEKKILDGVEDHTLQNLFNQKSLLLKLRKTASPQRDLCNQLTKDSTRLINDDARAYFRDTHDQIIYVLEMIENVQQLIANILSIHVSLTSNKMNEVMKILTIIATIVLPLTLISSIYGMNFKFMPELYWPNGYYIVLGVMAGIAFLELLYFRRKGWI